MPDVIPGDPVCTRCHVRLVDVGPATKDHVAGWCPDGEHWVYDDGPCWGHEPEHPATRFPVLRCPWCMEDRPVEIVGGQVVCPTCEKTFDPPDWFKIGEDPDESAPTEEPHGLTRETEVRLAEWQDNAPTTFVAYCRCRGEFQGSTPKAARKAFANHLPVQLIPEPDAVPPWTSA